MWIRDHFRTSILTTGAALVLLASGAQAKTVQVLYDFSSLSDGAYPEAGVIMDRAGNFYGTTLEGGTGGCAGGGCGTVFRLASDGSKTLLYSFTGGNDGAGPHGLIMDKAGNLYGVTSGGGGTGCYDEAGCGTIFELAANGAETVLHAFQGGTDGENPSGGLIADKKGNLYGTTGDTVFRVSADGKLKTLHYFSGADGYEIGSVTLARDKAGNLYGTTQNGGAYRWGTVFRVSPDGTATVLYSFTGGSDGGGPHAGVIMDAAGNLYGTTPYAGDMNCDYGEGCGTVFKLAPDGTETTLYTFTDTGVNANPMAGLTMDSGGNLYGTTYGFSPGGIFKLAPDGTEKMLYTFTGGEDGSQPMGGLLLSRNGHLYGTASSGGGGNCNNGFGCGAVFALKE